MSTPANAGARKAGPPIEGGRRVPPSEVRDHGYLQEANRRFFHPLGLALAVVLHGDGEPGGDELLLVDCRDDMEGVVFEWGDQSADARAKHGMVEQQWQVRAEVRAKALGFVVQPPPEAT